MELKPKTKILGKPRKTLGSSLRKKYEKGASIRYLASDTGRSYGFIHRLLVEAGTELRGRGGARPNRERAES